MKTTKRKEGERYIKQYMKRKNYEINQVSTIKFVYIYEEMSTP